MEAFERVWSVNSDMSVYISADCQGVEPGDVERMTTRVRGCVKQTVDTLEKVVEGMPDMSGVAELLNSAVAPDRPPEPGLLEVVGPVFCNSTRHFLLIQVERDLRTPPSSPGSLVPGRGERLALPLQGDVRTPQGFFNGVIGSPPFLIIHPTFPLYVSCGAHCSTISPHIH
jgi:hypothetical protein